jgi:hypothetical protein
VGFLNLKQLSGYGGYVNIFKRAIWMPIFLLVVGVLVLTGCTETDADVASRNVSKAAEQFEVPRRITFINGITDKYLLTIEGYCSVETDDSMLMGSLEVTCRVVKNNKFAFKKAFLGLSDNVSFIVEQLEPIAVSTSRYRVIFKPETIVPNFDRP